ncbi:MAG: hypothetical protein AAGA39_07775 [Pseudomonadota bacterium]
MKVRVLVLITIGLSACTTVLEERVGVLETRVDFNENAIDELEQTSMVASERLKAIEQHAGKIKLPSAGELCSLEIYPERNNRSTPAFSYNCDG